jgi:hypothetical protein
MPIINGFSVPLEDALIPGGVVGAHAVPGNIEDGDTLIAVLHITDGPPALAADLTAEFSITAGKGGSVTNTTTDTSGGFLLVVWAKAE